MSMSIKEKIIKSISNITSEDEDKIILAVPTHPEHGDFSTNIAIIKHLDANDIKEKLSKDDNLSKYISKIEIAGPGFINFFLSRDILLDELKEVIKNNGGYGRSTINKGKKVIVEYSSPNIAKPFTIGHLRSTIIGDALANLLEATGWKVYRDNHLGDWGTQFGKLIYAIKKWGNEKDIAKSENPVKDLVDLYVRFHKEADTAPNLDDEGRKWFKKLEEGDSEAKRIWRECISWSFKEFDRIYELLNIHFSKEFENGRGLGESFFEDKMTSVISELENKGLLKTGQEGAKLVFFKNDKYPPAMILKKDETTLYHTRDLATDKYRKDKFNPDLIINEVGIDQLLYFQQLFEIENMLGWFKPNQRIHIKHGLIRFKDKKMSTRKGNVIWLDDVLNESIKRAYLLTAKSGLNRARWGSPKTLIPESTQNDLDIASGKRDEEIKQIAVGALKWNDLKGSSEREIVFNWDEILNMQGNSGPYLQYTFARTQSVLNKKSSKSTFSVKDLTPEELILLRLLPQFPGIIFDAAKNYSPNLLCEYLYTLAQKYNSFYNSQKIIGSSSEDFRLALTKAVGIIIKNGLNLLGIKAPDKM